MSGGEGHATDSEAIVIEGSNSVLLNGTRLFGARNGAMIYQSFSGDAQGQHGKLSMRGGSLTTASGPAFFVTNSTADVELQGTSLETVSGLLAEARADRWGRKDANGGRLNLKVRAQTIAGALRTDAISDITLTLGKGASWKGSSQGRVAVVLEDDARWTLDADAYVVRLKGADCASGTCRNIRSKGHVLRYDIAGNSWAVGRTFLLEGGGELRPAR